MDSNINSSPQFIDTGVGLTVFYKERFLYSKRVPNRQMDSFISSITSSMESKQKTLFIFTAPVLGYGATELITALPKSSFLIFLECDHNLGKIFEKYYLNMPKEKNIRYLLSSNVREILEEVRKFTSFNFIRVFLIRGSAAHNLYESFYSSVLKNIEEASSTFWKNKITLIEMGRLYSKNLFKVLNVIKKDSNERFSTLQKNYIQKPIMVLGAGTSFDLSISFIKKHRKDFFLLAVDAILPSLSDLDIAPDAVLLLEGQYWIMGAFLASKNRNVTLIASLTSFPNILKFFSSNIFLYMTGFTHFSFLEKLKTAIPNLPFFDPLGSVGLLALQIALFIAKKGLSIFHTGLDFSWQKGLSHAKSSSVVKNTLLSCNKLSPLYKGEHIFPLQCSKIEGKMGEELTTTPILQSYAKLYKNYFASNPNIFDIGKVGIKLTTHTIKEENITEYINSISHSRPLKEEKRKIDNENAKINVDKINFLLHEEIMALTTLKNMFTKEVAFEKEKVLEILRDASYLYLHFPDYTDGKSINIEDISFLKRVKIEVEYFLKIMSF